MSVPSYLDADAWDALSLGGTLLVRDSLVKGKPKINNAVAVTVVQYAYDKYLRSWLEAKMEVFTGEAYVSALAANTVALTGLFTLLEKTKLLKAKNGVDAIDEGLAPKVKGKGMSADLLNSMIQSIELLIEQRLLMSAVSMTGVAMPSKQPAPALATQSK